MSFIIGYCTKCKEWKSQPIGLPCSDCATKLIDFDGYTPSDEFVMSREEAIQLLDFIRQSGYISYEFHPLISPLADKIRDHYKEKK